VSAAEFRQLQPLLRTYHVWRIQWELRQSGLVLPQDTRAGARKSWKSLR